MRKLYALICCLGLTVTAGAQSYRMRVTLNDGTVTTFVADNIKEVTFEDNGFSDSTTTSFIEVAGIKWATGNLCYQDNQWKIASNQWATTQYVSGSDDQTLTADYNNTEYFSWGMIGKDAVNGSYCSVPAVDLTQFYTDEETTETTEDYSLAVVGDVAKWATVGHYRMPTKNEFDQLVAKASQSYGYYTTSDGNKVYGMLFTNPAEGEDPEQDLEEKAFTENDINGGLFLPFSGMGYYDNILHAGRSGYYWTSTPVASTTNGRDTYQMEVNASDGATVYVTSRNLRCSIRPVVNSNEGEQGSTYQTVDIKGLNDLTDDQSNVDLLMQDNPATVIYVNESDVYLRQDDYAVRLSGTGLENKVAVGDVCMGEVKGDFTLQAGTPTLVGNADTEESLSTFINFPGGSADAVATTVADVANKQHRCDLVQLSDFKLMQNSWGLVYAVKGTDSIMVVDGFGLNAMPETIDSTADYLLTGIVAEESPIGYMTIYLTAPLQSVPASVEGIAAFKQIPEGASTILKLTNAVVTYIYKPYGETNAYLRDATGAICLSNTNLGLEEVGQTVSGSVKLEYSEGRAKSTEETSTELLTIATGEAPEPRAVALSDINDSLLSEWIEVNGVKIVDAGNGYYNLSDGTNTVGVSNGFFLNGNEFTSISEDKTYTVKGIVCNDGNGYEVKLTQWFTAD